MLGELRRVLDAMPTPKLGFVVTGSEKGSGYDIYDAYGYGYDESYYTRDVMPVENGNTPAADRAEEAV